MRYNDPYIDLPPLPASGKEKSLSEKVAEKKPSLYQPTVRGRASICHWDLSFSFLTKEQCRKFINLYLDAVDYPVDVAYKCEPGDSVIPHTHTVTILDGSWADSLETVVKILQQVDYQTENYDEDEK